MEIGEVRQLTDAELDDRLRAFGLGAADFVPKPFWIEEIVARLRARVPGAAPARPARTIAWADVFVDLAAPQGGPGDPILYQALKLLERMGSG